MDENFGSAFPKPPDVFKSFTDENLATDSNKGRYATMSGALLIFEQFWLPKQVPIHSNLLPHYLTVIIRRLVIYGLSMNGCQASLIWGFNLSFLIPQISTGGRSFESLPIHCCSTFSNSSIP